MLESFLSYMRTVLVRKGEGITDEEARRATCPPSDLTLLGLIRHMAEVERIWSQWLFLDRPNEPIYYGDAHPDGDEDGDFHRAAPERPSLRRSRRIWAQVADQPTRSMPRRVSTTPTITLRRHTVCAGSTST